MDVESLPDPDRLQEDVPQKDNEEDADPGVVVPTDEDW